MIVNVFPDHNSSAFWNATGIMLDEDEVPISESLKLAVKYWNDMWDFCIGDTRLASESYIDSFHQDGYRLVELMNAENITNYTFEYKEFR